MKYRKLGNTDMSVSVLGLGTSALGSVFRDTDDDQSVRVVHQAITAGINYLDTAPWYGHGKSEAVLGKALVGIPRDSYFLATKVGQYKPEVTKRFDFSAQKTFSSVDESLAKLGVDYLDVIQVHDMEYAPNLDVIINETLPALQKVKDSGKARFIGITGYPLDNFRSVLDRSATKIDTLLTYCHYSLNDTSLLEYIDDFKRRGVGVINASPLSMGLLTTRGPPQWHPATKDIREASRAAAQYCQDKGVDIARIAMDFSLSEDRIDTTLFSTASESNLAHNISMFGTDLNKEEKTVLADILDRFFKPLGNKNWEGLDVQKYRAALEEEMKRQ